MLAKFGRRPLADVIRALRELDAESLGISAVGSLLQFLPTAEDMGTINKFLKGNNKSSSSSATEGL
jgi:hypothetical protein